MRELVASWRAAQSHDPNQIYDNIAEAILAGDEIINARERDSALDILRELQPKVDFALKRQIALRIAEDANPPATLLLMLALDDIEIARPILEKSPALSEALLGEIIALGGTEHRAALATRSALSHDATEALIRRREPDVLMALIRTRNDTIFETARGRIEAAPETDTCETDIPGADAASEQSRTAPARSGNAAHGMEADVQPRQAAADSAPETPAETIRIAGPLTPPVNGDTEKMLASDTGQTGHAATCPDYGIALEVLRRNTRWLDDVTRAISDWSWETDRNGRLTFLSSSATNAFGLPAQSLLGQPLHALGRFEESAQSKWPATAAVRHHVPFRGQILRTIVGEEQEKHWELNGVPLFDLSSGKFLGYRGTAIAAQPVPPLWQNDTAPLVKDAKPATTQTIIPGPASLSDLTHEFKTPLNAIIGFSQMINEQVVGPVNDKCRAYAGTILTSAKQLHSLIDTVLDCARLEAQELKFHPEDVPIDTVFKAARKVTAPQGDARGVFISNRVTGDDTIFFADKERLEQILTAMLRQTVRHTTEGDVEATVIRHPDGASADFIVRNGHTDLTRKTVDSIFEVVSYEERKEQRQATLSPGFILTLARALARAMGGDLVGSVTKRKQLELVLTLPTSPNTMVKSPAAKPCDDATAPASLSALH